MSGAPSSAASVPPQHTAPRPPLWQRLLGFSHPVDRQTYVRVGAGLMLLKYGVDASFMLWVTGLGWTPADYLRPWFRVMDQLQASPRPWAFWALVAWSLPFMWVGTSMSVRRAQHAGFAPAVGLLFLLPVINWVTMVVLATTPGMNTDRWNPHAPLPHSLEASRVRAALLGVFGGAALALLMVLCSVYLLAGYGAQLFMGAPVIMGVVAGYVYNRPVQRPAKESVPLAAATLLVAGGSMLLFALEGAICVLLALPLAAIPTVLGTLLGRALAQGPGAHRGAPTVAALLLAWPCITGMEATLPEPPLREVTTVVDVDAPPATVWNSVVNFGELPEPTEWFFRLGIAYPVRASMEGTGVGAVRRCEFSTGPFVEPITTWDAPRLLAFDVRSQPHAMRELSPYNLADPPHFDGYLQSRRGQFLLEPLPGGRTRLSGTTWFVTRILPDTYWGTLAEMAIHAIHQRVLAHVKAQAERLPQGALRPTSGFHD